MSGHSKWATIKHKKAATDAKRGKLFTKLLREITVAARMGGSDPKGNARLRSALLEARSGSVPGDTIDRAIKKGSGELEGGSYEDFVYEGYGPGGIAVLVEGTTDNRNRTASEIRHLFTRHGGNLGENGCVAWMFGRRGYFSIERQAMDEEKFMELALDLGADDMETGDEYYEIYTTPEDFLRIREELEARKVAVADKQLVMIPQTTMELEPSRVGQVLRLMEALEDNDDVQHVWANLEFDEKRVAAES